MTKYYFAGSARIAMRKYTIPVSMAVEYLFGDHLGSSSLTTDTTRAKVSEIKYKPCPLRFTAGVLREGEIMYSWTAGLSTTPAYKLVNYTFTGQFSYMDDPTTSGVTEGFGLMFFKARFYDPYINRFAQADSVIPGGVQGLDRYAFVNNNSIRYTDPSGHITCTDDGYCGLINAGQYWSSVVRQIQADYNITFKGGWDLAHKKAAATAAVLVGAAFSSARGAGETGSEAFKAVYSSINFTWGSEGATGQCAGVTSGGCTSSRYQINFWSMSGDNDSPLEVFRMVKNVVHELGHAFDWTLYDPVTNTRASNHMPLDVFEGARDQVLRPNMSQGEIVPGYWDWQQSDSGDRSEVMADMFIAWTYGAWNTNPANIQDVSNAQRWMNGLP